MNKEPNRKIIVVEIPHQRRASAWVAYGENDFIEKVEQQFERSGNIIWEQATAREILVREAGATQWEQIEEDDKVSAEWIKALGDKHGWDTALYQTYYSGGEGYSAEPISHFEACVAALFHDLNSGFIWDDEKEALAWAKTYKGHQWVEATTELESLLGVEEEEEEEEEEA